MILGRRHMLPLLLAPAARFGRARAQAGLVASPIIASPEDPAAWPAFREALHNWRREMKARLRYDDSLYRREDFSWVPSSFCCCFLMLYDERFFDRQGHRFRVEEWLEEGRREFGGYDSVVLWHAYPRIGLDQRNQFDFYRDMPGGLSGLRELAKAFQAQGVRVYVDYNPWDTGTRREGLSDVDALVRLIGALGADGIFLDTLKTGSAEFRAKLDAVRPGVVLEGELELPLEQIHDHHLSWAQGFQDSIVPGVLRNKWFERRHMQHQIRRWNHDHTGELQAAWMNGSGILVWENVFGSWVGWSARDRSILRSMLPIQRRYASLFAGEGWTPLVPAEPNGVYASLWEDKELQLWTLVNRLENGVTARLVDVAARPGVSYIDLVRGARIEPESRDAQAQLRVEIPARGIGCVLAAASARLDSGFESFLRSQAVTHALAEATTGSGRRETRLTPAPLAALRGAPQRMARIDAASFEMVAEYRVRETGLYTAHDYTAGRGHEDHGQVRRFTYPARVGSYAIDLTPVTNAQYHEFIQRSGHRPRHMENFLKHWVDGKPPAGKEDHPVVYVSLEDARAYAAWAGKRLPTEEEWQYAAQGPKGFRYPWGNEWREDACNSSGPDTTSVMAFPAGRSPFGLWDMCGNTWEWTESERSDGVTRFAMIRGGSYYKAEGSRWYMDGGPRPCQFAAKTLLLWPGLDRCATVGFRCATGLAGG